MITFEPKRAKCKSDRGLLLIVMVGLLTLLLLLAVFFTTLARMERKTTTTGTDQARAKLLARSGVEYAVARLLESGSTGVRPESLPPGSAGILPASSNPEDDWRYRDDPSVPLEQSLNPSYKHGEPWDDTTTKNGRYDPSGDGWNEETQDLDGNGRYDGWSGRLRGTHASYSDRFKLRIEDPSGKISVNGNGTGLKGEPLTKDWNGDGEWDPAEPFTDRPQRIEKEGGAADWWSWHRKGLGQSRDVYGYWELPNGKYDPGEGPGEEGRREFRYVVTGASSSDPDHEPDLAEGETFVETNGTIYDYSEYWDPKQDLSQEQYLDGSPWPWGQVTRTERKRDPATGLDLEITVTYSLRLVKESFSDTIANGIFDPPEPFTDLNADNVWNPADEWDDNPPHGNNNGLWDGPQKGLQTLWDTLGERVGVGENLGSRLLEGGAYRSMEEVKKRLGEEMYRKIAPFATLHGRSDPKSLRPAVGRKQTVGKVISYQAEINRLWPLVPESRVPVSVNLAEREVLEAVLRPLEARFLRRRCDHQKSPVWNYAIHEIGRIEEARVREEAAAKLAGEIALFRKIQPFRSWRQWERFLQGRTTGTVTGGTRTGQEGVYDGSLDQIDDQFRAVNPFLNKEESALVNANVNPNGRLNKFNSNALLDRLIDKSDLTVWTTEWTFDPSGLFDVSSLGEVYGGMGAPLPSGEGQGVRGSGTRASSRIDTVLSLWETWRDTTQRDFASGFISDNSELETVPSYKGQSLQVYPEPQTPEHGAADWDGYFLLATNRNASPLDRQGERLLFYAPFEEGLSAEVGGADLACYRETDSDPHPVDGEAWPDGRGEPWHPGWPDGPSDRPNENSIVHPVNPGSLYPDGVWSDWRNVPAYAMESHVEEEAGGIGFWMKFGGRVPDAVRSGAGVYRSHTFCSFTRWHIENGSYTPYRENLLHGTTFQGDFLQIAMGRGTAGGAGSGGFGRNVTQNVLASVVGGFDHNVDTASPLPVPLKGEWNYLGTAWDRKGGDGWLFHNGSTSRSLFNAGNQAEEGGVSFEQDAFHRGRFRLGEISLPNVAEKPAFLKTPACSTIDEFGIYGPQGVRMRVEEEVNETPVRASLHPEHLVRMEKIWQREYTNGRYYNWEDAAFTSVPRTFERGTRFVKMSWTTLIPEDPVANHRILLDFFDGEKWMLDTNGNGVLDGDEEAAARARGWTDEGGMPLGKKGISTFSGEAPENELIPIFPDPAAPPDGQIRYRAYFQEDANWLTTPLLESPVLDDVTITYVPAGGPRLVIYNER